MMVKTGPSAVVLALVASVAGLLAQGASKAVLSGPVGPSPYDIVRGWHKPFAAPGFAWPGFQLPLDIIVNGESLWVTDLGPLRFTKLDFNGNHLYTWMVPKELPDGYLEVHTISVDSDGNLYGGDNQYGRTQKFVPKRGADPALLIDPPWVAR
jgi:hypothetical protein